MARDRVVRDYAFAFGRHVQRLRNAAGMARDELALLAGVSLELVASLEEGDVLYSPGVSVVERIAIALEVSPSELLPGINRSEI